MNMQRHSGWKASRLVGYAENSFYLFDLIFYPIDIFDCMKEIIYSLCPILFWYAEIFTFPYEFGIFWLIRYVEVNTRFSYANSYFN